MTERTMEVIDALVRKITSFKFNRLILIIIILGPTIHTCDTAFDHHQRCFV